jgi:NDP-sugar pyrophosphorylase family protein
MIDHALSCLPDGRLITLAGPEAPMVVREKGDVRVLVEEPTEGAACTVLLARDYIDNDEPLLIANCDQWIDWHPDLFVGLLDKDCIDGAVAIFDCPERDPKWSYVRIGVDWLIQDVVEKDPISDHATCGVYLFSRGSLFCELADKMIVDDDRVNGEFYVAPTIGRACRDGLNFLACPVKEMVGLGTPEDVQANAGRLP